jgi:cation diffusion facilitator family transporter
MLLQRFIRRRLATSGGAAELRKRTDSRRRKAAERVTLWGLAGNIGLCTAKAGVGAASGSVALLADGVHSAGDMLTDFITLWVVRRARASPTSAYPYGTGKLESLASLFIGSALLASGGAIGYGALWSLCEAFTFNALDESVVVHSVLSSSSDVGLGVAAVVAFMSIAVKEALYRYTMRVADESHSQVLRSSAWHHRSDALSSVAAMAGIVGALWLHVDWLDSAAGLVVAGMVVKAAIEIAGDAVRTLTDQNVDKHVLADLRRALTRQPDILGFHKLRVRQFGAYLALDLHVEVEPHITVSSAHAICDRVEHELKLANDRIRDVIIHVDPVHIDDAQFADEQDFVDAARDSPPSWMEEPPTSPDHHEPLHRPVSEIDADVRQCIVDSHTVDAVEHIAVHFLSGKLHVEAVVQLPRSLTVHQCQLVAKQLERHVLAEITDLDRVSIHLALIQ